MPIELFEMEDEAGQSSVMRNFLVTHGLGSRFVVTRGLGGWAPNPYHTLVEALVAWVLQQLPTSFPGGVWTDVAPQGSVFPYLILVEVANSHRDSDTSYGRIIDGQIQASIFGTGRVATRTLGRTLYTAVNNAPLLFQEGQLMYLRLESRMTARDPERSPGGLPIWVEFQSYSYKFSQYIGS